MTSSKTASGRGRNTRQSSSEHCREPSSLSASEEIRLCLPCSSDSLKRTLSSGPLHSALCHLQCKKANDEWEDKTNTEGLLGIRERLLTLLSHAGKKMILFRRQCSEFLQCGKRDVCLSKICSPSSKPSSVSCPMRTHIHMVTVLSVS